MSRYVDWLSGLAHYDAEPLCGQFHFANILSPWIRRALVAGGFGKGVSAAEFPTEVAPVMHFSDLQGAVEEDTRSVIEVIVDSEAGMKQMERKKSSSSGSSSSSRTEAPPMYGTMGDSSVAIVPRETPFFHLDLVAAVKAAERSHTKVEPTRVVPVEAEINEVR